MAELAHIDTETMSRFRAYLKLLASTQIGSHANRQVDASDLVQQTLLDAIANLQQFRGHNEAQLLAWLRQILANNLVDAMRYHGRAKRSPARACSLDESVFQSFRRVDSLAASGSTPSERAAKNEQLLRLPKALELLSDLQREAIVLHHLQGLKLSETAKLMQKSESAVCGLLHRGLERLHELLEG